MSVEDQTSLAIIMGFNDSFENYASYVWGTTTPIYESTTAFLDDSEFLPSILIDDNTNTNEVPSFFWLASFTPQECDMVRLKKSMPQYKDFMKLNAPFVTKYAPM